MFLALCLQAHLNSKYQSISTIINSIIQIIIWNLELEEAWFWF